MPVSPVLLPAFERIALKRVALLREAIASGFVPVIKKFAANQIDFTEYDLRRAGYARVRYHTMPEYSDPYHAEGYTVYTGDVSVFDWERQKTLQNGDYIGAGWVEGAYD